MKNETNMKLSQKQIRALITSDMIEAAKAVLQAKAYVATIRPIVEGYQKAILVKRQFTNKGEIARFSEIKAKHPQRFANDEIESQVILDPNHAYNLSDEDFEIYLGDCRIEQEKAGLKTDSPDQCPLLVAEDLEVKANRIFVDAMFPITKISADTALCSGLKNYHKVVELSLRLIMSLNKIK